MTPNSTASSPGINPAFQTLYVPLVHKPSAMLRLLWWCAGADGSLLERCPTDYTKYGNIGATVLLTSLLACISMTYALNAVFDSLTSAVGMGLVWAVVIFVLDRSIVSSMRKAPTGSKFFSRAAWSELPFLFVRMAVAIVIALTISKPLEVKIFDKRIAAQIVEDELKKAETANETINKVAGVNSANDRVKQSAQDLSELEERTVQEPPNQQYQSFKITLSQQNADFKATASVNNAAIQRNQGRMASIRRRETEQKTDENGAITYKLTNQGRNAIGSLAAKNRKLSQEIATKRTLALKTKGLMDKISADYQQELAEQRGQVMKDQQAARVALSTADTAASSRQSRTKKVFDTAYGQQANGTYPLMTQVSALGALTDKDNALWWASLLITLLFLVIETAPILVKLFSKRGAYDDELELAEHIAWVRTQYEKSQINSRINRKLEAINQTDERVRRTVEARQTRLFETATKNIEQQQEIELANNEQLLKLIAKRQLQLAERLIEDWHKTEVEKLDKTPASLPSVNNVGTPPQSFPASLS